MYFWTLWLVVLSIWYCSMSSNTGSFASRCEDSFERVRAFLELPETTELVVRTQRRVAESMGIFDEMLDQYRLDEVSLSYNGGKDCLVMLVIYMALLYKKLSREELDSIDRLNTVLVNYEHYFPELTAFIESSSQTYGLNLEQYNDTMKHGFQRYLEQHGNIKAIVVGTRRTDPYGSSLAPFQPTDSGWPSFMRVHPVLNWQYDEIWCFLRLANVPYCSLYDMGYTSLGGVDTTVKNPWLKTDGGEYRPAYELANGDERERDGRLQPSQ